MKISPVSFCGNKKCTKKEGDILYFNNYCKQRNNVSHDEFCSSKKSTPKKRRHLRPAIRNTMIALAVAGSVLLPVKIMTDKDVIEVPVRYYGDDSEYFLSQVADEYDFDLDLIKDYNGIKDSDDLADMKKILIPQKFDYLEEEKDELWDKLYTKNLSDEEREDAINKIHQYEDKQNAQQNVARVYTDGQFVYFKINLGVDSEGRQIDAIYCEDFKDLFDIKDGAIRTYNKVDSTWHPSDDPDKPKGEFYYSDFFENGRTIKVRPKDIDRKNISENY